MREASLAIINGAVLSVYTGEVLTGHTVVIKGDKIVYVGKDAHNLIGTSTRVIDAAGKVLVPGLIDGHTHVDHPYCPSELIKYAMKGGTTTIITEVSTTVFPLGYEAITQFLKAIKGQPIKILITVPPMGTLSRILKNHATNVAELHELLQREEVVGLGEPYWHQVLEGDQRILALISETNKARKQVEGHSAGARGSNLQAYIASGISSCHEPITAEEVIERLRLGLFVMIREGEIRKDLDAISWIKERDINFHRLAIATDAIAPWQLIREGYMEFVVQKAIDIGFDPVLAIQMATINVARHFSIDNLVGGIAPGKYADLLIVPNLRTIQAEYVISKGQIVSKNGQPLVQPKRHAYPKSFENSIHLPRNFEAGDFAVPVEGCFSQVRVRVIDQVTSLVTREAVLEMSASNGQLHSDPDRDILKIAAIERTYMPGRTFVGFIRGIGTGSGAIATSAAWDSCDIIVVGASETEMAEAVNRLNEIGGGITVFSRGRIVAETPLPLGGMFSTEPMETISTRLHDIQQAVSNMGCTLPDIRITLATLTTPAIPFLRICEDGLVDLKQNKFVKLVVE